MVVGTRTPQSFQCPITHELMRDPVTTTDGQSYERVAIEQWLKSSSLSPLSGAPLVSKTLTPNHALRNAIDEFRGVGLARSPHREQEGSLSAAGSHARKLILLGDMSVGKTALLLRLKEGQFCEKTTATVGCSFCPHLVRLGNGRDVLLNIWDTAGAEKYRAFTRQYFRGAAAVIIMYDITRDSTFRSVPEWLDELRREVPNPRLVVALAGSKCDLKADRQVLDSTASRFAKQEAMPFFEVSAKDGTDVKLLFTEVARLLDERMVSADRPLGPAGPLRFDSCGGRGLSEMEASSGTRSQGLCSGGCVVG